MRRNKLSPRTNLRTDLRVARVAKGLTQSDLALKIDRSQAFISYLETRRKNAVVSPELARKISDALGVPAPLLFHDRVQQVPHE